MPRPIIACHYDGFEDRSFLDPALKESVTSVFTTMTYSRPEEALGTKAIEVLREAIDLGIRLRGGKSSLGFLFMYELMTSSLDFKILETDSTFHLGNMLLRFMPEADTNRKSTLMSLLRITSSNVSIAQSKDMPKWKDERKFKISIVFQKQNVFEKFFTSVRAHLEKISTQLIWPSIANMDDACMPEIEVPRTLSRSWVCPRIANFACSRRELTIGVRDSTEDIRAFASAPLMVLGLQEYIAFRSRQEKGEENVLKNTPFDLRKHSNAQTPIAKAMIDRIDQDKEFYSQSQNDGKTPQMKLLFEEVRFIVLHCFTCVINSVPSCVWVTAQFIPSLYSTTIRM
jgi:hypothetical protein